MPRILLCAPEFHEEHGGIQQYSRLLAAALQSSPLVDSLRILEFRPRAGLPGLLHYLLRCSRAILGRPDLCIHTHVGLARTAPLLHAARVPYWICAHGIECWHLRRRQEVDALLGARRILAVSRCTRDRLLQQLPALAPRTVIFPNHVTEIPETLTPRLEARRRLGLPPRATLLLTISRLRNDRYKGHRKILAALDALGPPAREVHYAIGGDGDDEAALRREAAEHGLQNRVHFLGSLTDPQRRLAYDACDAFVMPSTGEGFGIVYLEALAHGKPVLAGSVDGSIDALEGCPGGILVNPRDPASVALGLASLLRRLRGGEPLGDPAALRHHVLTHFGPQRLQERVDLLLQDHLRNPPPCAA